ncbi:hypothetical protein TREES_T100021064 [Tupaia chinensis]|uniref:Uncharacterized protein n=1 Tax=Tupaia chinensis TaxID=246437 RepID=L9JAZ3_TUPCH|nr:hypothetical protein TREES_T100021064 [Tupaia chinensis]
MQYRRALSTGEPSLKAACARVSPGLTSALVLRSVITVKVISQEERPVSWLWLVPGARPDFSEGVHTFHVLPKTIPRPRWDFQEHPREFAGPTELKKTPNRVQDDCRSVQKTNLSGQPRRTPVQVLTQQMVSSEGGNVSQTGTWNSGYTTHVCSEMSDACRTM